MMLVHLLRICYQLFTADTFKCIYKIHYFLKLPNTVVTNIKPLLLHAGQAEHTFTHLSQGKSQTIFP